MASVFLSYDHNDRVRAAPIAAALTKAGHSVWWDRHIMGGAQYSKEIEQALKAADVVVVLWSAQSVESPWVRDEAATGRDRGRLVPVALDKTEAPLGFRQFQTIDLSSWKRRGTVPRLADILHSIDGAVGEGGERQRAAPVTPAMPSLPEMSRLVRLTLLTGLVFVAIALAFYLVNRGGEGDVHTVVVTAADPQAKPVAQDLLLNLGNLQSVQGGSVRLLGDADKERPDLIFEASAGGANQAGANLVLMDGKDRAILWSEEFGRESGTPADLELQMTYTAGRVLGCALEALEPGGKALGAQTLKLYLAGCSQFAEGNDETVSSAVPMFEQVVRDAPRFKAAWGKLLIAESNVVASGSNPEARQPLRQHIAQARLLDPEMPEATLAEVTLLPRSAYGEALRLLDQVRARNPENDIVLGYRALALMHVGRTNEAVEEAGKAARLDPTSPDAHGSFILTLAHSGRIEAARSEMRRAERQWAGTGRLEELRHAFNLRYGDPKEMLDTETYREANPRMQLYYRTRADPTPANVDRFMAFLQGLYSRRGLTAQDIVGHAQAYGEVNREDDLYSLIFRLPPSEDLSDLSAVIFRPSLREFWHDPRFMIVAKRIGLVDYWTKSGKWPDFCFDPDQPYDCKAAAAKLAP